MITLIGEATYPNDPRNDGPSRTWEYTFEVEFRKADSSGDPVGEPVIEEVTIEDDEPLSEARAIEMIQEDPTAYSHFLRNEEDGWAEIVGTI